MELLKELCSIHAPSGEEEPIRDFIISYVQKHQHQWVAQPELIWGDFFQNCVILKFGVPKTAVFAHIDSIGFTVRYQNQLVPIGSPNAKTGDKLMGKDCYGPIECELHIDDNDNATYQFGRAIQRGTSLTYHCNFKETDKYIQSCYLDNRLGVYNALKLAETLTNGIIVFSCWEEHGGGSVPFLTKYIYEQYGVKQALISDITWVTDGVTHGNGVVISMRDHNIPRQSFVRKIIKIADQAQIDYQLEVEATGSSDGRELQLSPYPFDWCFIGAPESFVHSPNEKAHKYDIQCMLALYKTLMDKL